MEWLADPQAWIALLTLTVLEIVLGIDNVIFISILAGKLPAEQQKKARTIGLALAMIMRVLLLLSLAWIVRLTAPLFTVFGQEISGRDLILLVGGLFLLAKATHEIHDKLEGEEGDDIKRVAPSFASVIVQISLLDIVFSLDSVITAVGMAKDLGVMITAVIVAVLIMLRLGRPDQRLRQPPPDGEDAGAQLPAADRHVADRRRARVPHPEGLRLLRDGLLGLRRDAQHPVPPQGQAGQAARRLHGREDRPRRHGDASPSPPAAARRRWHRRPATPSGARCSPCAARPSPAAWSKGPSRPTRSMRGKRAGHARAALLGERDPHPVPRRREPLADLGADAHGGRLRASSTTTATRTAARIASRNTAATRASSPPARRRSTSTPTSTPRR